MVLCDLKSPRLHITNAAGLGCFDLEKEAFSYDLDIPVIKGFALAGQYKGIPVSVAIGDNQASVFSTLADERDVLLNVGTGSQISVVSDHMISGENIEVRPYFEDRFLIVGAALCGGRAYSMLKNFYQELFRAAGIENIDVYRVMEHMIADRGPGTMKVDTRFAGTRSAPGICGQITGITVDNFEPDGLTYAFLEGMIEELYAMYEQMREKKNNLVGSGNGIRRNKALVQVAEKRFGGILRIPVHTEEAAYGAALYGLVAGGFFENAEQAQTLIQYNMRRQ